MNIIFSHTLDKSEPLVCLKIFKMVSKKTPVNSRQNRTPVLSKFYYTTLIRKHGVGLTIMLSKGSLLFTV